MICQLKALQDCFPSSLRRTLDQLPKSLDETYVRVLRQIPLASQAHAHRMLQCLMVAVRPLRVEELAELLAFEFDAAQGGIPKYRAAWQLDDQTQAVLSTCSSLVTIIDTRYAGQIVQFSHFSVKEFLMSNRLGDFSRYHIHPLSAHTILTQACLGVLLHLDDHIDKKNVKSSPLTEYAARHWVEHAQIEGVASRVEDGMETLFDSGKPHFAAWVGIYDMDDVDSWRFSNSEKSPKPKPDPLYYSVLCGFFDLVKHLTIKYPERVNATYGRYRFPLLAALEENHFEIVELLLDCGANPNARDTTGVTSLVKVLLRPQRDLFSDPEVRLPFKHVADVNTRNGALSSSLHLVDYECELAVAQILVKHKADVNSPDNDGRAPLHILLECWATNEDNVLNLARLLLEHGADANRRDKYNHMPLPLAIGRDWFKLARILLDHGADANAKNNNGDTPLHMLSERHAQAPLDHGANVDAGKNGGETSLYPRSEGK